MSCSAIPFSTNRSGSASSNARTRQSEARSASSTTRRGSRAASSSSASPYAAATYSSRRRRGHRGAAAAPAPLSGSPWRLPSRSALERRDELEGERREAERLDPLAQPAFELAGCRREVVVAGRARVPAVRAAALGERPRVLHERDALALDRPRDEDARGLLPVLPQLREGVAEGRVVVPVAGHDAAAERAQLRLEALEREDLLGRPVGLELVAVDDHEQAADALVRRRLERLPVLALLQLAVAGHHDDAPAATRGVASPRRSRAPSRSPSRASPSSPRSRARRRRGGRRGRRAAGGGAAARQGSRRARSARRRGPGRRGPWTRRRRRGRASRSRPRRRSGSPRAGGRRGRAS